MKTKRNKFLVVLAFLCTLSFIPTTSNAGMCEGCGDYVIIGGQSVFYCGSNGNTHCLYKCGVE